MRTLTSGVDASHLCNTTGRATTLAPEARSEMGSVTDRIEGLAGAEARRCMMPIAARAAAAQNGGFRGSQTLLKVRFFCASGVPCRLG